MTLDNLIGKTLERAAAGTAADDRSRSCMRGGLAWKSKAYLSIFMQRTEGFTSGQHRYVLSDAVEVVPLSALADAQPQNARRSSA